MSTELERMIAELDQAQRAFDAGQGTPVLTQPWSQDLVIYLSMSVLGFSCLTMFMATALLWRIQATPQQILRIFGIIVIVGFSALLLVVGYDNEQLTPIVGLFGAISGYLLAKDPKAGRDE